MDLLAIGDVVVDAFIKLKDARVHCNINDEDCEICMRWGDKIPFEAAYIVPAVGNSANAAVAASRLGLSAGLRAYIGNDRDGEECLESLRKDGVSVDLVEKQDGKKTNYHYVLWYESQRTILVKHETFNYAVPALTEGPKWLYLSSLGENSLPYHLSWIERLAHWPSTKLAFQPGTFQLKFGKEQLANVYRRSDIVFCNKEEAERLLGLPAGTTMKVLLQKVQELGPKSVVITDDARGAHAIDEQKNIFFCPRYPDPRPPFEITGAGDAFASTTVAALILGHALPDALLRGATNASAVLQEVGAQKGLLTREQLEHTLANPPAPFAISQL
ncbi:MAG: carbohydrate kinase family protein [Patescibacteria group bacterium]